MNVRLLLVLSLLMAVPVHGADDPWRHKAREIYARVVAMPSVHGKQGAGAVAEYLAAEFRAAGFADNDVRVLPYDTTAAFMARLPAAGKATARPILLIAHMDVVDALATDWSLPPFELVERDGYFYGRGTNDNKGGLVAQVVTLLRLKAEGFRGNRDLVIFFTGDEETDGLGARKMADEWRHFHNAEFALNSDGGGGEFLARDKPVAFVLQAAEKIYVSYTFTTRNRGGHSSVPRPDNAIYDLAQALGRLAAHRFPPMINDTTRAGLLHAAHQYPGVVGDAMRRFAADPSNTQAADVIEREETLIGKTRTTCVATMLAGGHAENALPQTAAATVNCRVFPGMKRDTVLATLQDVAGPAVVVEAVPGSNPDSEASPLRADVVQAYEYAVQSRFPGVKVVPQMSNGATDGAYLRAAGIATYGVDGLWGITPDDDRAHGRDERVPLDAFYGNLDHWYRMLTRLAGEN